MTENSSSLNMAALARREFLKQGSMGIGSLALASMMSRDANAARSQTEVLPPMYPAKAKNVIFIHALGAPSQIDLLDPKPVLNRFEGKVLPKEMTDGVRFAFVDAESTALGSPYKFEKHGKAGIDMSELLPHMGSVADELTVIRSMKTDVFNHGGAELFMHSGFGRLGRPSFGSWVSYGLGSVSNNLPTFVVLKNGGSPASGKNVWTSGFLPTVHQGVEFRAKGDPVLYLTDPKGMSRKDRSDVIDTVNQLNQAQLQQAGDPETQTRIAQYEMAFRMQSSVPDLMDIKSEPQHIIDMYGAKPGQSTLANNCLLARRLVERGVRFVQLFDKGWDHHSDIFRNLPGRCRQMDQPVAALIKDLKQRGMLEDTLVIWGGEFGRTPMAQAIAPDGKTQVAGRDHHIDAFSIIMAGGGIKAGHIHGQTDELGFRAVQDVVHVHDFHATALHLLGIDHTKLSVRYAGLDMRLTGVKGKIVDGIIA